MVYRVNRTGETTVHWDTSVLLTTVLGVQSLRCPSQVISNLVICCQFAPEELRLDVLKALDDGIPHSHLHSAHQGVFFRTGMMQNVLHSWGTFHYPQLRLKRRCRWCPSSCTKDFTCRGKTPAGPAALLESSILSSPHP